MKKVIVITGGGSGMGLATIKELGKEYAIVITGRTLSKLEKACEEYTKDGYEIYPFACDVSKKDEVKKLAEFSKEKGEIVALIHAAGVSPHMGNAEDIIKINALGTHFIDQAFKEVMGEGSVILNVSSMAAYMLPNMLLPKKHYAKVFGEESTFFKKLVKKSRMFGSKMETSLAYPISKNFVCWYTKRIAKDMYKKGIRVISVSPGNFETPMGELESAQGKAFLKNGAIQRFGKVEEIALLFKYLIDPRLGYLTGEDIICDGGCVGSLNSFTKKEQKNF